MILKNRDHPHYLLRFLDTYDGDLPSQNCCGLALELALMLGQLVVSETDLARSASLIERYKVIGNIWVWLPVEIFVT
ncbi:hypothetical protein LXL04_006572 [Taraxacum kok-saghyz]